MHPPIRQRGFSWSLNPIFNWMRLFGIALDRSRFCSKRRFIATTSFSISVLVFSFLVNAWAMGSRCVSIMLRKDPNSRSSFVENLVLASGIFFTCIFSFVPHLAFLMAVRTDWKTLFDTIQQIERSFASDDMFQRCSRVTKVGMVFITVVNHL